MEDEIQIPALREDGLQLEEHRAFQERYWSFQRIGWIGYGVAILLALLGLTGSGGPFHKQEIRFSEAVAEVPRIARWEAWDEFRVTFTTTRDVHELSIPMAFLDMFEIGSLQPDPNESDLATRHHQLRFSTDGPAPHEVRISTRPMHFGWISFELGLDGESRTVRVLVLP